MLRANLEIVTSIEALDPQTVRFNLSIPYANLPAAAAGYQAMVVSEAAMDTLTTKPVGTGPFRFLEYRPGDQMTLEKAVQYGAIDPRAVLHAGDLGRPRAQARPRPAVAGAILALGEPRAARRPRPVLSSGAAGCAAAMGRAGPIGGAAPLGHGGGVHPRPGVRHHSRSEAGALAGQCRHRFHICRHLGAGVLLGPRAHPVFLAARFTCCRLPAPRISPTASPQSWPIWCCRSLPSR